MSNFQQTEKHGIELLNQNFFHAKITEDSTESFPFSFCLQFMIDEWIVLLLRRWT